MDRPVILAVDDERMVRDLLTSILRGSYRVVSAREGGEALRILGEQPVDLVITDIAMPGMGGLALADRMRREFPQVPVAFVSAYIQGDVERLARQRSRHILRKPFDLPDVMALVRGVLDGVGGITTPRRDAYPLACSDEMEYLVGQVATEYRKRDGERREVPPPPSPPPPPMEAPSPLAWRMEDQLNLVHLRYDLPVWVQRAWLRLAALVRQVEIRLRRRQ